MRNDTFLGKKTIVIGKMQGKRKAGRQRIRIDRRGEGIDQD